MLVLPTPHALGRAIEPRVHPALESFVTAVPPAPASPPTMCRAVPRGSAISPIPAPPQLLHFADAQSGRARKQRDRGALKALLQRRHRHRFFFSVHCIPPQAAAGRSASGSTLIPGPMVADTATLCT